MPTKQEALWGGLFVGLIFLVCMVWAGAVWYKARRDLEIARITHGFGRPPRPKLSLLGAIARVRNLMDRMRRKRQQQQTGARGGDEGPLEMGAGGGRRHAS